MGHLNSFFASTGGNLNKPIFKSSNAREVDKDWGGGGGMLNFRIEWRIITDVIYSLKDTRYSVTVPVSADLIKAMAS